MNPETSEAIGWLLIIVFAFAYFFGRAHGRLAERKVIEKSDQAREGGE